MEWQVTFDSEGQYAATKYVWSCMTMKIANPVRRIYQGESSMTIRAKDLGEDYEIPHLYRYWKQQVSDPGVVNFFYQFDRSFLQRMWPSSEFSDLTLKVDHEEFRVHRVVLGVSSLYFRALLTKMIEANQSVIEIKEVQPEAFKGILRLLYGYRVEFSGLDGARLLVLIRRFNLGGITEREIESLIEILTVREEDLLEFIDLVRQIYGGEYPGWFIGHFFDQLTPKETTRLKELFPQLPDLFQRAFEEDYGPLSVDDDYKSAPEEMYC